MQTGLEIHFNSEIPIQDIVNQLMQPLIGSFKATTGHVIDNSGKSTEIFASVIHNCEQTHNSIPINNVAAIIDCYEELTIEILEDAYQRIKSVKSLMKPDSPKDFQGEAQMTTGIILSRKSELTLEQISNEMDRLNALEPSHYWPDAIAVTSTGIINYSAHVPGSLKGGDFFLPVEAYIGRSPTPSMWVQKVIRPAGDLTFNKVASLIMVRVAIFQPGLQLPDYRELIKDIPQHGVATQTYQFNLANTLLVAKSEDAIARLLTPETFNIVSGKEKLGSVQYQSWQDGGVIIVSGAFPIDIFFVFMREVVPELSLQDMQYLRNSNTQTSYVLPLTKTQFLSVLSTFQQRSSNISIEREESRILLQKIGDEGTTSPFVARLMMGIMVIRDYVYGEQSEREYFDKLYEHVLSGLRNARETSQDLVKEWELHRQKVESGEIVVISGRSVHLAENIDRQLKRDLENFLNTAVRVIKHHLQSLTKDLGLDIDFLFKKPSAFEAGITTLKVSNPELAEYMLATRSWTEPLIKLRNDLEHGEIPSPKVSYILETTPIKALEPSFNGTPITLYICEVLNRICCFAEEITVYSLKKKLPKGFEITEVPLTERESIAPERFHVTVTPGGRPPWRLVACGKMFAEI